MTLKLNTASGGSISLTPTNTASTLTLSVPAIAGSLIAADANGNVGIGTNDFSGARLSIVAPGNSTSLTLTDGTNSTLQINHDAGSLLSYRTVGAANQRWVLGTMEVARLLATGQMLIGYQSMFAGNGAYLTLPSNGSTQYGITIQNISTATTYGMVFINYTGSQVGTISNTTSNTSYNTTSDYRLKENVQPMQNALLKVMQLKPVTYTWKLTGEDGQGFIAHELQEVVPDAVTGEKDALDTAGNPKYQGVDTSFLVATLTAAIQEQQSIIEQLKTRIEALEQV